MISRNNPLIGYENTKTLIENLNEKFIIRNKSNFFSKRLRSPEWRSELLLKSDNSNYFGHIRISNRNTRHESNDTILKMKYQEIPLNKSEAVQLSDVSYGDYPDVEANTVKRCSSNRYLDKIKLISNTKNRKSKFASK